MLHVVVTARCMVDTPDLSHTRSHQPLPHLIPSHTPTREAISPSRFHPISPAPPPHTHRYQKQQITFLLAMITWAGQCLCVADIEARRWSDRERPLLSSIRNRGMRCPTASTWNEVKVRYLFKKDNTRLDILISTRSSSLVANSNYSTLNFLLNFSLRNSDIRFLINKPTP